MEDGAKVGAGGTAAWLFEEWERMRKRDLATLAALHARTDRIIAEGIAKLSQSPHLEPGLEREVVCLGANMSPAIEEGELTHVDTSVKSFSGNGIYCLEFGRIVLIRRLIENDDGALRIVSDNPNKLAYPDQLVPVDERWKITIAGRVVRWLRVCSERGAS